MGYTTDELFAMLDAIEATQHLCECGCGEAVVPSKRKSRETHYLRGHRGDKEEVLHSDALKMSEIVFCKCGCGTVTKWEQSLHKYNDYIHGHATFGLKAEDGSDWSKGLTKETNDIIKARAAKTQWKPWAKGKTKETDNRIAALAAKGSVTHKQLYAVGKLHAWNKGLTKETNTILANTAKKISDAHSKAWSDPEYAKAQHEKLSALFKELWKNKEGWIKADYFYPAEWNKKLKKYIRFLDNNCCVLCNTVVALIVHHVDGLKEHTYEDNLVTLCKRCHGLAHSEKQLVIIKALCEEYLSTRSNLVSKAV